MENKRWQNLPTDVRNQNGEADDDLDISLHRCSVKKYVLQQDETKKTFLEENVGFYFQEKNFKLSWLLSL